MTLALMESRSTDTTSWPRSSLVFPLTGNGCFRDSKDTRPSMARGMPQGEKVG